MSFGCFSKEVMLHPTSTGCRLWLWQVTIVWLPRMSTCSVARNEMINHIEIIFRVARLSLKSHNIRNAEDDEDLDLFVDNDEDDPIDNEKENISQDISRLDKYHFNFTSFRICRLPFHSTYYSSESTIADRGMNRCSKNSCHFRKESICLEMGYQEQPPFKS